MKFSRVLAAKFHKFLPNNLRANPKSVEFVRNRSSASSSRIKITVKINTLRLYRRGAANKGKIWPRSSWCCLYVNTRVTEWESGEILKPARRNARYASSRP